MTLRAYYWRAVVIGAVVPLGATAFLAVEYARVPVLLCGIFWLAALCGLAFWFDYAVLLRVQQASSRADAISRGHVSVAARASPIEEFITLDAGLTRADRGLRAAVRLLDAG